MHETFSVKAGGQVVRSGRLERRAWYNNGILASHLLMKRGKWVHCERYDYTGRCLTWIDAEVGFLVHEGRQPQTDHHGELLWQEHPHPAITDLFHRIQNRN